jgi:hypothetical protein
MLECCHCRMACKEFNQDVKLWYVGQGTRQGTYTRPVVHEGKFCLQNSKLVKLQEDPDPNEALLQPRRRANQASKDGNSGEKQSGGPAPDRRNQSDAWAPS